MATAAAAFLLALRCTRGAWIVGEPGESCTAACDAMTLTHPPYLLEGTLGSWECAANRSAARHAAVDSAAAFEAAARSAGHGRWCITTIANPHALAYPATVEGTCYYAVVPGASASAAECGALPTAPGERRLCCCVIRGSAGQPDAEAAAVCPTSLCPPTTASATGYPPQCRVCSAGLLANRDRGATACVAPAACPAGTFARSVALSATPTQAPTPHPTFNIAVPTMTPAPTSWSAAPTAPPLYPTFQPTSTQSHAPTAASGVAFTIAGTGVVVGDASSGLLVYDTRCVTDGVGEYGDGEAATITATSAGFLYARGNFSTEELFDFLLIKGIRFEGTSPPMCVRARSATRPI